ncbi:hypothetical protein HanRHA438_Chr12g0570221 [Helianthus annuus]|uniref:Uncharacterized protein n=1 Tax=Helianthus annuus TaxID=4232 RepID=A0A9K3HJM9_HELAN|nr:hypothetical protein HanXRQr2_Chr12g0558871 [Helianthus annuus]KAJ0494944.1 hypothetical protein HanIR_Chr12g0603251 [Helianthus annuus]KAJ0864124.1 hypothetical protein HanPSC8_Chr12g0538051 [Helianthus annuus]KAJ0868054.1 hypothetical protein HanRHA438_Chr12g0570221 [Helianthus annuus]
MPTCSTKGIKCSHDFSVSIECVKLLSTVCDKKLSVLEMRFSSQNSSVISKASPAQRSAATLADDNSIFTV